MSSSIEDNMRRLLETLANAKRDDVGDAWVTGRQLQENTGLSSNQINDSVAVLCIIETCTACMHQNERYINKVERISAYLPQISIF